MIRLRISKWRRRSSCSSKQQCGSSAKSIIIFKRRKNEKKKKNKMATFNAPQFYAFALCFLRIVCAVQCLCVSAWIFSNNITSFCTFFHVVYTVCAKTIRKKYVLYIWKKKFFFSFILLVSTLDGTFFVSFVHALCSATTSYDPISNVLLLIFFYFVHIFGILCLCRFTLHTICFIACTRLLRSCSVWHGIGVGYIFKCFGCGARRIHIYIYTNVYSMECVSVENRLFSLSLTWWIFALSYIWFGIFKTA